MRYEADPCDPGTVLALRERYRIEMDCQLVSFQIHAREGWTETYSLLADGEPAGFGTKAMAGPWRDQPTLIEFYVAPEQRRHVLGLFDALLAKSGARHIETQSNATLLADMLHAVSRDAIRESILFEHRCTTSLPANGASLRQVTPEADLREAIERRDGGGEWQLLLDGALLGHGGILFHYNRPYGDIHMEIEGPHRRRGWGAYFVQELKRACWALGAVPAARCNADNLASRHTLQKAGFAPCGHRLKGSIAPGGRA